MLLCVDVGNTNIVVAIFQDGIDSGGTKARHTNKIVKLWRIYSDIRRTGDEYFTIVHTLFREASIDALDIDSSILSCVVPELIGPCISAIQKLTLAKPILVAPAIYPKLPIHIPKETAYSIGSDIVCNSVAAWECYHSACIIVDFGTALTFTAIDSNANIIGVAIAPGIGTALKSLSSNTALLPTVPLECPPSVLGSNTVHAIQAGIIYGYKGLVESMIEGIKLELKAKLGLAPDDINVIATGGLNSVLEPLTKVFTIIDKEHTLKGLKAIADLL